MKLRENCTAFITVLALVLAVQRRLTRPGDFPVNLGRGRPALPPAGPGSQPTSPALCSKGIGVSASSHVTAVTSRVANRSAAPLCDPKRPRGEAAFGRCAARGPTASTTARAWMAGMLPEDRHSDFVMTFPPARNLTSKRCPGSIPLGTMTESIDGYTSAGKPSIFGTPWRR